jgi:hypothetical protein
VSKPSGAVRTEIIGTYKLFHGTENVTYGFFEYATGLGFMKVKVNMNFIICIPIRSYVVIVLKHFGEFCFIENVEIK